MLKVSWFSFPNLYSVSTAVNLIDLKWDAISLKSEYHVLRFSNAYLMYTLIMNNANILFLNSIFIINDGH